jgi:hypothetical protein
MQHASTPLSATPSVKPSVLTRLRAHAHVLLRAPLLTRLSPCLARRDPPQSPLVARIAAATVVFAWWRTAHDV